MIAIANQDIIDKQAQELERVQGLLARIDGEIWASKALDHRDVIEISKIQEVIDLYHEGLPAR